MFASGETSPTQPPDPNEETASRASVSSERRRSSRKSSLKPESSPSTIPEATQQQEVRTKLISNDFSIHTLEGDHNFEENLPARLTTKNLLTQAIQTVIQFWLATEKKISALFRDSLRTETQFPNILI